MRSRPQSVTVAAVLLVLLDAPFRRARSRPDRAEHAAPERVRVS